MRKRKLNKKDVLIIILSILLLAGIKVAASFFDGSVSYQKHDLPANYDPNFSKLVISEIVTKNKGVYANEQGEVCDYVEIYNSTNQDVNLFGFGLSDEDTSIKWVFPNVVIKGNSYLVVNLTGQNENNTLNANFKLSSSGKERLILTNAASKIIDGVDTVSLDGNQCMARDDQGQWYICDYCTPGFENSMQGLEKYHNSLLQSSDDEPLIINEFLTRNKGNYLADDDYGFIEFKNNSLFTIDLSNYTISNDIYAPFKVQLDDVNLLPGQIYYYKLGNSNYFDKRSLGINLNSQCGSVILGKNGKIVKEINYDNLPNGCAYQYYDGHYFITNYVSAGYENNSYGIQQFQKEHCLKPNDLIINEVMNNNFSYLVQNSTNYYDWIELYNNSNHDINLADYCLSDKDSNLALYQLPAVTLSAGQYYIVMCSGDINLSNSRYQHANFKVADNTGLYLSKNNKVVDCIHIADIPAGCSMGRGSQPGYFYFDKPTPNQANSEGKSAITVTPIISLAGGLYNDVEKIDITIYGDGDIFYTLNGDEPTRNSRKYSEPLTIKNTCCLRVKAFNEGMMASEIATNTYVVNDKHAVSVVCLSLDNKDFDSINRNIYRHDYRENGYIEYFDGNQGFTSKCGIGIFGDESRKYPKKNYLIKFDKQYNTHNLHYQVFEDRDNADYDTLALRAGSQAMDDAIFTDTLLTSLIDDYTDVDTYASKTVIVYINGRYWGYYTLKEKKNANYFEDRYNVDGSTVNMLQSSYEVNLGDCSEYLELVEYIRNHDLTNDKYYDYVCTKLDIQNWADFWIGQMYCANADYFNVRFYNCPDINDGKWRCIFYDLDFAFYDNPYNSYTRALCRWDGFHCNWANAQGAQHRIDNIVIKSLLKNKNFQKLWFERLAYNLKYTWNKQRVLARLDELEKEYSYEVERNQNRWGYSIDKYYESIAYLRYSINRRTKDVLNTTQSYFHLSDKQMKEYFGDIDV